jgi:putative nucleotidyltransferase with HDIG domain
MYSLFDLLFWLLWVTTTLCIWALWHRRVARVTQSLQHVQEEMSVTITSTIEGWAYVLELRDHETARHSRNVAMWAVQLARAYGFAEEKIPALLYGAMLHDIGKIGLPDAVLLKTNGLTPDEWVLMRGHCEEGVRMLSGIPFLRNSIEIPQSHHERWDGKGYPQGLKGEQIPLAARLFSVVDTYDAIIANRPYRRARTPNYARQEIRAHSGSQFDPDVVDVFMELRFTKLS